MTKTPPSDISCEPTLHYTYDGCS